MSVTPTDRIPEQQAVHGLNPTDRVVLCHVNPAFGRMYLTADGSLSSAREQAAEHYAMQARAVIADSWLLRRYEPIVAAAEGR